MDKRVMNSSIHHRKDKSATATFRLTVLRPSMASRKGNLHHM
jgi:hypothetical protein